MKFIIKNRKSSLILCALIVFGFALMFIISNISKRIINFEEFEELMDNYLSALKRIDELIQQNRRLISNLSEKEGSEGQHHQKLVETTHPSLEYEKSIRRIERNLNDLWLYLRQYLNSTEIQYFNEWRYNTFSDLQVIKQRDNEWRQKSLQNINQLFSDKLMKLQNPRECKTARKLVCNLTYECGFGCTSYHWTYCLISALALNRTLILKQTDLMNRFNDSVLPISETCFDITRTFTFFCLHPMITSMAANHSNYHIQSSYHIL